MHRLLWIIVATIALLVFFPNGDSLAGDNPELVRLVEADQKDRSTDSDEPIAPKDDKRRKRVFQLLAQGVVRTPGDKYRAALILQHTGLISIDGQMRSISAENYYLAYELAKAAYEEGYLDARRSIAVFYDRYSWLSFGFQKYGTQAVWTGDEEYWVTIDSTTTDAERAEYGVRPLSELLVEIPMEPGTE